MPNQNLENALEATEIVRVQNDQIVIEKDGQTLRVCDLENAKELYDVLDIFSQGVVNSINAFDRITISAGEDDGNDFKCEGVEIYLDLDEIVELQDVCKAYFDGDE